VSSPTGLEREAGHSAVSREQYLECFVHRAVFDDVVNAAIRTRHTVMRASE
jgi:hypothetical protein